MTRIWLTAMASTALAAAPAHAQQMQHDAGAPHAMPHMAMCTPQLGGMQHGQQGGMQHADAGMTPWDHEFMMFRHHAQEWGLTQDQLTRIAAIRERAQTSCMQHMQAASEAHAAAEQAFAAAEPDLATFEAKLEEATSHMVQAQLAVARAAVEAHAVLTPEQREKAAAERVMHGAMQQARGSGGGHTGH